MKTQLERALEGVKKAKTVLVDEEALRYCDPSPHASVVIGAWERDEILAEIERLRAENKKLEVKLRHNVAYGAEK